jgi:hypothetical protein
MEPRKNIKTRGGVAKVTHKTHVLHVPYCETCGKLIDENEGMTTNPVIAVLLADMHKRTKHGVYDF